MKQFAFIKSDGQISYILSPSNSDSYIDGSTLGEYLVVAVPGDINEHQFITTQFYFEGEWKTREPQPSHSHKWENFKWVLDTRVLINLARNERNRRLQVTDWQVLPDSPFSDTERHKVLQYRQELRDMSFTDISSYETILWPTQGD